jgi:hypothetical protein
MPKISRNKFFVERPIPMRDRKGEESGSDLPLHSGVLALPEFRIRTRKQFPCSGNCWELLKVIAFIDLEIYEAVHIYVGMEANLLKEAGQKDYF